MAFLTRQTVSTLGLMVNGDLADLTIYTMKTGQKVFFPKSPPKEPPSPDQITMRNRWRQAATGWKNIGPAGQTLWKQAIKIAEIPLTAYNVYLSLFVKPDPGSFRTIERLAGFSLPQ